MASKKMLLCAVAAAAAAFAVSTAPAFAASESTTVQVGTYASPTSAAFFILEPGSTPFTPSIVATFGNTIGGASTTFDDFFDFTIPQNGVGSGSLSTSFSAASNELTISDVLIDGTSYTAAQAAAGVSGIPIKDLVSNAIEVQGVTSGSNIDATYDGTATFAAVSAAPEPSAWLLMIGGIACVGAFLRRRPALARFA